MKELFGEVMILLLLLLLTGCIIPISPVLATDNPRSGVWVTETGHQWIWEVKDNVSVECGGFSACTIYTPGERVGRIIGPDSRKIWTHECAHALGFSRAMSAADIEAELNHTKGLPAFMFLWSDGPAMQEPCGASTWSNGDKPGRLKTLEQWQTEMERR